MTLDQIDLLHDDPVRTGINLENLAGHALAVAGRHLNRIIFFDLHLIEPYSTSGARESIFMKFFGLNS